ncbi:MAG: hypothetical protein WDW38_004457 [Sanguina aurantia]
MGEVAALAAAFDAEFSKALSSLPNTVQCPSTLHDAHLNHHRAVQRIAEAETYYASRLPASASVPRVLGHGDRLVALREHRLAQSACYGYVKALNLHTARSTPRMDEAARLSAHVQACFGVASCEVVLLLESDPQVKHPDTLSGLLACIQQLQAALTLVLPHEPLYWLSLNGSIHIYKVVHPLLAMGFSELVLPPLLYVIRAIEGHVTFSASKFLPWRTQLYTAAAHAFADARSYAVGRAFLRSGIDRLEYITRLQKLDPVPALPSVTASHRTAAARMSSLLLKLEAQGSALTGNGGGLPVVTQLLASISSSPSERAAAVVEALQVPGRRVLRREPIAPGGLLQQLFELAWGELGPAVAAVRGALTAAEAVWDAGREGGEDGDMAEGVVRRDGPTTALDAQLMDDFPLQLHKAFLCTAYSFQQLHTLEELQQLAQLRCKLRAFGSASAETATVFEAVSCLLAATNTLAADSGVKSLKALAAALRAALPVAAHPSLADIVTDAALMLLTCARPLLDGVFCPADEGAPLVAELLGCLNDAFEAVALDDGATRAAVSMKLALLLEEGGGLAAAQRVLIQAKRCIEQARGEVVADTRHAQEEHLRWITASRNQPDEAVAGLVQGMGDTEQELTCLHTDITAQLFRVQLRIGVAEQQGKADCTRRTLLDTIARREEHASIFGSRTATEKRGDDLSLAAASSTTSNPAMKERELLTAVGKNAYEHALLLMQMAPFQSDTQRQIALLQEAGELLVKAQAYEDAEFACMQPAAQARTRSSDAPLAPRVLQRNRNSVTLTHFPLQLRGSRRPASFSVLCKSYGAGVGLSINKTAMEYPGSGIPAPLDSRVTVNGLRSNDTYIFAVVAYDEAGAVIGGIGASSPEIVAALPLPLYLCYGQLAATACQLGLWGVAKRASAVLLPHFVITSADRPIWEANPMDLQVVHRPHLSACAKPLLRSVIHCIYGYTGVSLSQEIGSLHPAAAPPPPAELKTPQLQEQVVRLRSCRTLLIAMQLSALLPDEMLIEEGALRSYNMLGPLLALPSKSPLLHKALASIAITLQEVTHLAAVSLQGQEHQRSLAARVGSAACYGLMVGLPPGGGAAEEKGALTYFGRLELELLKAYDPKFALAGRPELPSLGPEASALQAGLLGHPRVMELSAQVLALRRADEGDLAAQVLPLLSNGSDPMEAWAKCLAREDLVEHPRWVEMSVRVLEACVRSGRTANVALVAEQVTWSVKSKLKPPSCTFPKWDLASAMGSIQTTSLDPVELDLPAAPEGLEERADLKERYGAEVAVATARAKRRLAAVLLLQRRLPALMERRRALLVMRASMTRWSPWLARLNAVLGLMLTGEARTYLAAKAEAGPQVMLTPNLTTTLMTDPPLPLVPLPLKMLSLDSETGRPKAPPQGSTKDKSGEAAPVALTPPVQALLHLSRSMTLGCRGCAWHELVNSARHLWNCARLVLNADTLLTQPLQPIEWQRGPAPAGAAAPASLIQPAPASKVKTAAAAASPAKKGSPSKVASASKKDKAPPGRDASKAKKGEKAEEAADAIPIWLAVGSTPNTARALRCATEALLGMVAALRSGSQFHTAVIPLPPQPSDPPPLSFNTTRDPYGNTTSPASQHRGESPTLRDTRTGKPPQPPPYAPSEFDFGSDVDADKWFAECSLDMAWVSKFVEMVLLVLLKMQRWNGLLCVGREWVALSQGLFDEAVLPMLVLAAGKAGADTSGMSAALEVLVRDKNVALDHLSKVRLLVRERLGETSLLSATVGGKARKKRRPLAPAQQPPRPGTAEALSSGDDAPFAAADGTGSSTQRSMEAAASVVSATYTQHTAGTNKSKLSQPDFLRLPAEYVKVIEVLKKRGGRAHLVLATHELGDVHAHFGDWRGASVAWNDALDMLLGPYQVLRGWRKAIAPLTARQLLSSYGVHGLLMGGGLLVGKLARYSCYDSLHLRLESCRLSARLLGAIFCSSVAHPQREVGFSGYVPRELWAGAELWGDAYKCNVTDLMSGLETVCGGLLDNDLALEALPVISLWEHMAYHVTRSLATTVLCRIQRVTALLQLGLLAEAAAVLGGLVVGAALPDAVLDSDAVIKTPDGSVVPVGCVRYRQWLARVGASAVSGDASDGTRRCIAPCDSGGMMAAAPLVRTPALGPVRCAEPRGCECAAVAFDVGRRNGFLPPFVQPSSPQALVPPPYSTRHLPGHPSNKACLAFLADTPLHPALEKLYGAWLVAHLSMAQARLLMVAGGVPNAWRAADPNTGGYSVESCMPTQNPPQPYLLLDKAMAMAKATAPVEPASKAAPPPVAEEKKAKVTSASGSKPSSAPVPPRTPTEPVALPVHDRVAMAQRAEVMTRTLLLQSELALLQWQPASALLAATEAAAHMSRVADDVNIPTFENDETERYSLSPTLWIQCRVQVVRCTAALGHTTTCHSLIAAAQADAALVNEQLHCVGLNALKARLLAAVGQSAEALAMMREAVASYKQLSVSDTRVSALLLDAAALSDSLGLRQDSERLAASATSLLQGLTSELGLREQREHPELVNVYVAGVGVEVWALLASSVGQARRWNFEAVAT